MYNMLADFVHYIMAFVMKISTVQSLLESWVDGVHQSI